MKNQNFVVEVIQTDNGKIFVIRDMRGAVVKYCTTPDELATFFSEVKFES